MHDLSVFYFFFFFFFKEKTAYEIGLGIPAEPLFRSRFCQKLTRWMRRSGLICLARSSRTGLDMSHILFMVEILLLTKCDSYLNQSLTNVPRSEERFSRNAETDLVCRLLLEKKKQEKTQ